MLKNTEFMYSFLFNCSSKKAHRVIIKLSLFKRGSLNEVLLRKFDLYDLNTFSIDKPDSCSEQYSQWKQNICIPIHTGFSSVTKGK